MRKISGALALGLAAVLAGMATTTQAADKPADKPAPAVSAKVAKQALPRTRDGHPDFEGVVWAIPYQAFPESFPGTPPNLIMSEGQAKAVFAAVTQGILKSPDFVIDDETDRLFTASLGFPLVRGERHSRLVVSPADGKLPLTPAARAEFIGTQTGANDRFDNPEERPAGERCLDNGGMAPSVFLTEAHHRQFIQTPGYVAIQMEYGDETRIIPFATQHGPWAVHPQGGDGIARWDGDTLVIETVNFPYWARLRLPPGLIVPQDAKVTERFTRLSKDELLYQFTVEEPKTYTAPWLAEYSLYPSTSRMFPSGCHEGNYSLPNILAGAREAEKARLSAKK